MVIYRLSYTSCKISCMNIRVLLLNNSCFQLHDVVVFKESYI